MCKHILVLNDTQEIQELFKILLQEEGYQVSTFSYGTEDLEVVRRVQPTLIIADYPPVVREEQGWQFVQKIKMARDLAHIPIIVCTTNLRSIRDTEGWLGSKGILVVPKPFSVEELLTAVELQIGKADADELGLMTDNAIKEDFNPTTSEVSDSNPDTK